MAVERKFINEAIQKVKISKHVHRELERVGCGHVEVKRTPLGTRIVIHATKPGLVIGRKGKNIQMLTDTIKNRFKIDNPQIEVQEVGSPQLDANIMAKQLALSLEKGIHFRRASYSMIREIMNAGALGAQIEITGKISGSRARNEKFKQGFIKHCGKTAENVDEGIAEAVLKAGKLGIKVKITPPGENLFRDLRYKEAVEAEEEVKEAGGELAEPEAEKPEVKEEKAPEKEEKKEVKKKAPAKKAEKKAEKKTEKKPAKKASAKEKPKAEKKAAKKEVEKPAKKAAAKKTTKKPAKKVTKSGSSKKK
jgi:small subunit ribosomal protein S3